MTAAAAVPAQRHAGGDGSETWELVRAAQDGDRDAFGQLYTRYHDRIYTFIRRRIYDRELAEDFTHDTFTKALAAIGTVTYQGRDIFAWLITIARNLMRDHWKSRRFTREVSEVYDTRLADNDTEREVLDTLAAAELRQYVAALSPAQAACLTARYFGGKSVDETAILLNRNSNAVKAVQHRAVWKLAERHLTALQGDAWKR